MSNHSHLYPELCAKREAKMFHRLNVIAVLLIGFVIAIYFGFEILRTI